MNLEIGSLIAFVSLMELYDIITVGPSNSSFVVQPNESVIILIEQQILKGLVNSVGAKFRLIQVKISMTGH